ncbi:hypothetical protein J7T55_011846 [Diaporthe amygdali]|uniref:uncharacterized protein n=1 Tax=Phomopsis amygdali TaxID=1214568 RepID=UPI0022FE20E1|nr:uncharacterized protein J7T55_011846 [Diaporthe amygdali]KAJ0123381.1 hypothetical protein J7T55_011846 [Diaporthe amygdali]
MASQKNGDIRSFFTGSQASKPPASSAQSPKAPATVPGTPSRRAKDGSESGYASPSPFPDIHSSPPSISSPTPRAPISRDAVIAASDDEFSDSDDDSLPDILRRNNGPTLPRLPRPEAAAAPAAPPGLLATPRAKRTAAAHEFHSSPLTIQSKKQRQDLSALLEFTRKDEEIRASAQRFSAMLEQEAEMQRGGTAGDDLEEVEEHEGKASAALKEHILEAATAAANEDGEDEDRAENKMRVVRALQRAEVGGTRKLFYFFEQAEPDPDVVGRKFPRAKAKGPWAILDDAQDRGRHFASGFPYDIQKKLGNLPDEIFLWVLDELCSERRKTLQTEYVRLLSICNDQTTRLVTPALLQQLFRRLGATKDVDNLKSPVILREETWQPYPGRDWSCVEGMLDLLGALAGHFTPNTRSTAMRILLRLGMDSIAVENFGFAQRWRQAVDLIARSVPDREWTAFCQEVCHSLYQSSPRATMRLRAVVLLGPSTSTKGHSVSLQTRTLDLKRRLASVFFFDDLQRADKRPEDTVNIRAVIDRLEADEFQLNSNTDYNEFEALMMLLNAALGDASRQDDRTGRSAASFDAEVDELAENLKGMLTRVSPLNRGLHVSRIEAKNAMELIRERLLYQIRIKDVPKKSIFGTQEEAEDSSLPKQRDFMKGFFLKKENREPSIKVDAADAVMAG